jgi:transposase
VNRLNEIEKEGGKNELKEQFILLRAKGYSYTKIARRLKVAIKTLVNWNKELSNEIGELEKIQFEKLFEQYSVMKQGRIKLLGTQLKEIEEELKKRDYSDVRTDKLIELKLQIYEALINEYSKIYEEGKEEGNNEIKIIIDKVDASKREDDENN